MVALTNSTTLSLTFFLTGIPGLEDIHIWVSIPFCCLYVIALSGNSMILFVIITEQSLHEPMYYFLFMLSTTDICLSLSTLPTTLGVFWFNAQEITLDSCISQLFFIHFLTIMESSVLLAMSFDRFIAICDPLRYSTILTPIRIIQFGLMMILRGSVVMTPVLLLLKRLSFCKNNILSHSYCYHPDVIKHSCSNTRLNSIYGLIAILLTFGLDAPLIILSYVLIIHSLLSIASPHERQKGFNTCVSHIGAISIFYIPLISLSSVHRWGHKAPPFVHTMMSNAFLLLPPVLNPIIYSIKTKQIRKVICKIFRKMESRSNVSQF
ncbi:olfactory receptor 51F2-like [Monodelphis domestica]|uniref:olfactory receptor 51F2-like n=1 Tax=Monodelphis domestica TaxID=13616 RepID=UPI00020F67B5|nr:olfactory receptor 51F2-like [Monodelphis domestica]